MKDSNYYQLYLRKSRWRWAGVFRYSSLSRKIVALLAKWRRTIAKWCRFFVFSIFPILISWEFKQLNFSLVSFEHTPAINAITTLFQSVPGILSSWSYGLRKPSPYLYHIQDWKNCYCCIEFVSDKWWVQTCMGYHPSIISEPTNQVR